MKRGLLILLLILGYGLANAQTNGLNGFDANGKKHGRWIVYLDAIGSARVKDSTKAVYKRYTWFNHGVNLYPMITMCEIKGRIETNGAAAKPGGPVLLNGEYKGYDRKGRLGISNVFKDGEYVSNRAHYPSGKVRDEVNFIKHCDGLDNSLSIYYYDEAGKITKEECYKRDAKGNIISPKKKS